ncbi:NUDIX hydrolase [Vreelandella sp. EE22]
MSERARKSASDKAPENTTTLRIAAALMSNGAGELLLVRKQGSRYFMQPGGKIEQGESADRALFRELEEELGLHVDRKRLTRLETVRAVAANEADTWIEAELFSVTVDEKVVAAAEIAEVAWVCLEQAERLCLAPLSRDYVLPWARRNL